MGACAVAAGEPSIAHHRPLRSVRELAHSPLALLCALRLGSARRLCSTPMLAGHIWRAKRACERVRRVPDLLNRLSPGFVELPLGPSLFPLTLSSSALLSWPSFSLTTLPSSTSTIVGSRQRSRSHPRSRAPTHTRTHLPTLPLDVSFRLPRTAGLLLSCPCAAQFAPPRRSRAYLLAACLLRWPCSWRPFYPSNPSNPPGPPAPKRTRATARLICERGLVLCLLPSASGSAPSIDSPPFVAFILPSPTAPNQRPPGPPPDLSSGPKIDITLPS